MLCQYPLLFTATKGAAVAHPALHTLPLASPSLASRVQDEDFGESESRGFVMLTADMNVRLKYCHKVQYTTLSQPRPARDSKHIITRICLFSALLSFAVILSSGCLQGKGQEDFDRLVTDACVLR